MLFLKLKDHYRCSRRNFNLINHLSPVDSDFFSRPNPSSATHRALNTIAFPFNRQQPIIDHISHAGDGSFEGGGLYLSTCSDLLISNELYRTQQYVLCGI